MHKQCWCGTGFELYYKQRKQLLHGFNLFCGGECLHSYLKNHRLYYNPVMIQRHPLIYPSRMEEPFDYWCPITKRFYRSKGEATFAIWCNSKGIKWEYEPFTIMLTSKKEYNPDFWLPEYCHFIEVKGAWGSGAKKKLRMTVEKGFFILLIPDYLIRILERENRR